ncbi:MAG: class I SAM-dependent methyltransferase [Salibacteraceae bacterium]
MAFEQIAADYDATFTHSEVGKKQRKVVWRYLDNWLQARQGLQILELNCGTGEDALHMAEKGHKVLATDQAENMLHVTRRKAAARQLSDRVRTQHLSFADITPENLSQLRFDLVFSDFGGLNCIDEKDLDQLARHLAAVTTQGGSCILVVMPRFCMMESLFFLRRLDLKKSFRRNTAKAVPVQVESERVPTWYHAPRRLSAIFARHGWQEKGRQAVGFFVPPSYTEPYFGSRPALLDRLERWDLNWTRHGKRCSWSDHYLIEFRKAA